MTELNPACPIDSLNRFYDLDATVDVLRLDLLHPVVSGNKWFKLQYYLQEARATGSTLLTFGGAYSNHLAAVAFAAASAGLQSIGVVRGEKPRLLSPTLVEAAANGMQLYFTSRHAYREKALPPALLDHLPERLSIVPEGGFGVKGREGAKDILLQNPTAGYTHIITAVGTGTTLSGLVVAADATQRVIGIPVLKNNGSVDTAIRQLLPPEKSPAFELQWGYDFGGYARNTPELLRFMNEFYSRTSIPTDFVYTAKTLYAVFDLLKKGFFNRASKILFIHTGGLQGNRSLAKGTLIFDR